MMDQVKSIISPAGRRKKLELATGDTGGSITMAAKTRTSGIPVKELMARVPASANVPQVLSRICKYIYKFATTDSMDLLCQSSSVQVADSLHEQFELMGNVNFEQEENGVALATGLLRQFFLDLSDGLIPTRLNQNFFKAVQDLQLNKESVLNAIKSSLNQLPTENYCILKYTSSLLVAVAEKASDKEKSYACLAALFSPCIFRCHLMSSCEEQRDKDFSEDAMLLFISEYSALFLEKGDQSPQEFWIKNSYFSGSSSEMERKEFSSHTGHHSTAVLSSADDKAPNTVLSPVDLHRYSKRHSTKVSQIITTRTNERDTDTVGRNEKLPEKGSRESDGFYPGDFDEDKESSIPVFMAKPVEVNDSDSTLSVQSPELCNNQKLPSHQLRLSSDDTSDQDLSVNKNIKVYIPPIDLSTLHEYVDDGEMPQRHSGNQMWMKTDHQTDSEEAVDIALLLPKFYSVEKNNDDELNMPVTVVPEAPLSPSANSDSGLFRASLDIDVPPSPPVQQDLYKKYSDDDYGYHLKQLTKKIQGLKRKIKNFEETFQRDHGYKPSQGEKMAHPDIRKHMNDLSRVRKDLKRLKDDAEMETRSRHSSSTSSSGVEFSPPGMTSVAVTLAFICHCLEEKRREAGRPEEVMLMSSDQLLEEKLEIQNALQHLEGLHPITWEDRNVMRPLYDRYRSVKRILSKPLSPCLSMELQTVHEDQILMEIPQSFNRDRGRVPLACQNRDDVGTSDFGFVTEDLPVFGGSDFLSTQDKDQPLTDRDGQKDSIVKNKSEESGGDARLHEMTLSELHVEMEISKSQKRRLRRALREFEADFLRSHGRKVQKEDRYPLQIEYGDYKKVKARLRLLEALILKRH